MLRAWSCCMHLEWESSRGVPTGRVSTPCCSSPRPLSGPVTRAIRYIAGGHRMALIADGTAARQKCRKYGSCEARVGPGRGGKSDSATRPRRRFSPLMLTLAHLW